MTVLKTLNPENVTEAEYLKYPTRVAARAVVFDKEGNVVLLFVSSPNFYKLPGGGIEGSEEIETALKRECLEEIGCEIEIFEEIGSIVEYRKFSQLKQVSHCYLAKIKGDKGVPQFTQDEIDDGFKVIWLPFSEALKLISDNTATSLEGKEYIVPRDVTFLKAIKNKSI